MNSLYFIAYSDIHYHHYTNGVRLEDVAAVEEQILDSAIRLGADFILFGGDRYMSRNPMYEAALMSDTMLKKISESGIPFYALVGNHDRLTKNDFKMHTMSHVGMYSKDLPNITIMDQRKVYRLETKTGNIVDIHAVPAGHEPKDFVISPDADWNICVFHGIILGSWYHNGTQAQEGLSVSSFDKKGFDLVLAGDNHKYQKIVGLSDCEGYYIGAPMQHNWGDEGSDRGYMWGSLSKLGDAASTTITAHSLAHTVAPRFMKVSWKADTIEQLIFAATEGIDDWADNIIKLTIFGPSDLLNDLDLDQWKTKLTASAKARTIDIKLSYDTTVSAPNTSGPMSDADEWKTFLATKSGDMDKVDVAYVEKLGLKYISNV